jgi:hypothetical protein
LRIATKRPDRDGFEESVFEFFHEGPEINAVSDGKLRKVRFVSWGNPHGT